MPRRIVTGFVFAVAGFVCWTVFSLIPLWTGSAQIREAWDTGPYWSFGLPALFAFQAAGASFGHAKLWRPPLYTVAGHFAGVVLINRAGTDAGLLPLSTLFIGTPMFGFLLTAAWIGRAVGNKLRTPAA